MKTRDRVAESWNSKSFALAAIALLAISCGPPSRQWAMAEDKAVGIETQKTPKNAPEDQREHAGQNQRLEPPSLTPAVTGQVVGGDAEREGRGEHHDAADQAAKGSAPWDAKNAVDLLTLIFTGLVALGTVLLWRATIGLVRGADRNAARQLRAYVGLEEAIVTERGPQGGAKKLAVRIRNFGQVPAKDVAITLAWTDQRHGYGLKPEDVASESAGKLSLMPGAVEEIGRLHTTQIVLTDSVVVGRITYEDGFGAKRFTNFRLLSRLGSDRFARDSYGNDAS